MPPEATTPAAAPTATPAAAPTAPAPTAPAAKPAAKGKPPEAATAPVEVGISVEADADLRAAQLVDDIRAGKYGADATPQGGEINIGEDGAIDLSDSGLDDVDAAEAANDNDDAEAPANDNAEEPAAAEDETPEEKAKAAALEREAAFEREKQKARREQSERETRIAQREQQLQAEVQRIQGEINGYVQALEKQRAEYETRLKSLDDPDELLTLIADRIPAEKLAKHIEDELNPARQAERAVRRAQREAAKQVDPRLEALTKAVEEMRQRDAQRAAAEQAAQVQAKAEADFVGAVESVATTAPLVASLLKKNKARAIALADRLAAELFGTPEGQAAYARLDGSTNFEKVAMYMQEHLADLQFGAEAAQPPPGKEAGRTPEAAAPQAQVTRARTLTNRTAAGRSSPVDDLSSRKHANVFAGVEDVATELKQRLRSHRTG